jgi:hypothetical protein
MSPSKRPLCEVAEGSLLIDRREFARSGALGALAPIFGSLENRALGKEPRPEALSVGYLRGSGEASSPDRLPWLNAGRAETAEPQGAVAVVPARSLPYRAGASETKPLRMTVHGLYPAVPEGSRLLSVWLDLVVSSPDPSLPEPVRFAAWSYASRPVPSASPGTSFVLPNGGQDGVTLVIETLERPFLRGFGVPSAAVPWDGQVPAQGTRRRYEARLHASGTDGQLPLRRGVYLLGLKPSTWHWPERLPGPDEAPRTELLSVAVSVRPEGEA